MILRTIALAVVAATTLVFTPGCIGLGGCDPGPSADSPVALTASSVTATRVPPTCTTSEPAFTTGDQFTLQIVGTTEGPRPYDTLTATVPATIADQPIPLSVAPETSGPTGQAQTAVSSDGSIQFSFAHGSDDLDSTPIASVVLTVAAMPAADGQPLSVNFDIYFVDGRELTQTYSAPVTTVVHCP